MAQGEYQMFDCRIARLIAFVEYSEFGVASLAAADVFFRDANRRANGRLKPQRIDQGGESCEPAVRRGRPTLKHRFLGDFEVHDSKNVYLDRKTCDFSLAYRIMPKSKIAC
ncbi:MAG: hypothetical protein OXE80_01600 [Gammaproteobacteria bacterium]|nr:hypothetical protein [Gammaproteobacteria bacterium]